MTAVIFTLDFVSYWFKSVVLCGTEEQAQSSQPCIGLLSAVYLGLGPLVW